MTRWLTAVEAAEALGVHVSTIYEQVRQNKIGHRKIGRRVMIDPNDALPAQQVTAVEPEQAAPMPDVALVIERIDHAFSLLQQVRDALEAHAG